MKPSEILRKAAMEEHKKPFSGVTYFTQLNQHHIELLLRVNDQFGYWCDFTSREFALALCFAAAIAESEGN
jgi:hypothetical protein